MNVKIFVDVQLTVVMKAGIRLIAVMLLQGVAAAPNVITDGLMKKAFEAMARQAEAPMLTCSRRLEHDGCTDDCLHSSHGACNDGGVCVRVATASLPSLPPCISLAYYPAAHAVT